MSGDAVLQGRMHLGGVLGVYSHSITSIILIVVLVSLLGSHSMLLSVQLVCPSYGY